jgi:hypothetical protein
VTVLDRVVGSVGEYVAGQLRAEMARRQISVAELARHMDKEDSWLRKRHTGRYGIALDEVPLFAEALGMPVSYFLPPDWVAS